MRIIKSQFFTVVFLCAFTGSISAGTAPSIEVGAWGNFCKGAISHTFDDLGQSGLGQILGDNAGQAAFDAYKFHMTAFIIAGSMSNWDGCKKAFAKGHEIASHNNQHNSDASGVAPSQQTIKKSVPGEMCVTMAYPNCNTPGDATVLKTYIAGRNCTAQTNPKTPSNFAQINAKMFGSGSCGCPNDAASMNSFADQAASGNAWAVTCHHGIGSDSHSWAVTSLDAVKTHLKYLDQNRSKIWIETFGNVARYIKERDAVGKPTVKSSDDKSITVELKDNLPDSIFNFPLSLRTELPSGWTSATVKQGSKTMYDTILTADSKQYIMFQAVPDAGDVVISKGGVKAMQRGQGFGVEMTRPVLKMRHASLLINPESFGAAAISVALYDLNGKLLVRESLEGNASGVELPLGRISRSAFIAKVAGNGKTFVGTFMPQL
jgi:hypothetical protein